MKRAIPSQSASEESEQVSKTERVSFGYQPSIRRCQHPVAPEPAAPPPPSDPAANEYSREQARKQKPDTLPLLMQRSSLTDDTDGGRRNFKFE